VDLAVELTPDAARALRAALHAAAPGECVGLLGGRRDAGTARIEAFVPTRNADGGGDGFAVAPADFAAAEAALRDAGLQWLGFAHGHPTAAAEPSLRDRASFWSGCLQAIVGPCGQQPPIRVYVRDGDACRELPCREPAATEAA
jgi:proteasome lid subunit RPN8/RPN11